MEIIDQNSLNSFSIPNYGRSNSEKAYCLTNMTDIQAGEEWKI